MGERTLLLDLDGTLVDTVPDLAAALNRLMRSRGLAAFSLPAVTAMVGDGVAALVGKAFAAHGRAPDGAAVADFSADYQASVAVSSRAFPDVPAVLADLAAAGWQLAVCTNKPGAATAILLDALDLRRFFAAVGAGDSYPVKKPHPGHLLATLAAAKGIPERAIMLGDHRNDVIAARDAGIRSVFALWGYGDPSMGQGSDGQAADIRQAASLVNRLLPAA